MALIYITALVIAIRDHGKPRTGTASVFDSGIGIAIGVFVLYMGGFWG